MPNMFKEIPLGLFETVSELVSEVGPPPAGVDEIDYYIASVPPRELTRAAKEATFGPEVLKEIEDINPIELDRFNALPHPTKALADEILKRQQQLSRTRRRLATFATVLALGSAGFATGYHGDLNTQHEVSGGNHPTDTFEVWRVATVSGVAAGVFGGAAVGLLGFSFAGRLARRPAQKLVNKARTLQKTSLYDY